MADHLLIELLTEELPPKALARLMEAFSRGVFEGLKEKHFLGAASEPQPFATPRRLAVLISQVLDKQADRVVERKGPAVAAGFDAAGKPTPALLGFAKSCGVAVEKLERRPGDKGEHFVYSARQKGESLKQHLAGIVEAALKKLPVPKTMRWGSGEAQFVRPVHGIIMLHGRKVVPGEVLGLKSGNKTRGHRFLSKGTVTIAAAKDYEKALKAQGKIIPGFETRRDAIAKALDAAAGKFGKQTTWSLGKHADLIDEVASIVEFPQVYAGSFDKTFLDVPGECLIISMQQHQKYFPLADAAGRLLPDFLFVSNMKAATAKHIVHGNERVLRARLSDARFFFDQDRKTKLADRVPRLAQVVYHNKLGSQLERVQRIGRVAGDIARMLKADAAAAERAAYLAKADLLTDMVGEFPELQGIMGRYYARHDGEPVEIADAIEQHYWPRAAGGELPRNHLAVCVALADKLDTLVGIYGIGLAPTGDKDPFGLRRAALGVVRILAEKALPLDMRELLVNARANFTNGAVAESVAHDLHGFMLERLKPYLKEKGYETDEIEAVVSLNPTRMDHVLARMKALREFRALPEAQALAAANKRIRNILRQAGNNAPAEINSALLTENSEIQLAMGVQAMHDRVQPLLAAFNYTETLKQLASLRPAVDDFFDRVMVMADDKAVRDNRLALLNRLSGLFLNVADISRLQG
jgi:glycyl-tRNA synthetase beta chain